MVAQIDKSPLTNGNSQKPGTFRKGNPGGPGNPLAKEVARLRAALVKAVTKEDIILIAHGLIRRAKRGDVSAAHEVFDRVLGKAPQAVDLTSNGESVVLLPIRLDGDREL